VWLTVRQNVWCWPAGLVNVSLFAVVFLHARLYGATSLQVVYVALCLYGWYEWLHGGTGHGRLVVSRTPALWVAGLGLGGVAFAVAFGLFLKLRTDEVLPFWDSATTAFSLVAQWMTTRKWIENWVVWIAVDVVYVGMYVSQRLYLTALLYAVFLVLAVAGLLEWRRSMGTMPAAEAA
jgi:nicotinamide mononucleotide transporter